MVQNANKRVPTSFSPLTSSPLPLVRGPLESSSSSSRPSPTFKSTLQQKDDTVDLTLLPASPPPRPTHVPHQPHRRLSPSKGSAAAPLELLARPPPDFVFDPLVLRGVQGRGVPGGRAASVTISTRAGGVRNKAASAPKPALPVVIDLSRYLVTAFFPSVGRELDFPKWIVEEVAARGAHNLGDLPKVQMHSPLAVDHLEPKELVEKLPLSPSWNDPDVNFAIRFAFHHGVAYDVLLPWLRKKHTRDEEWAAEWLRAGSLPAPSREAMILTVRHFYPNVFRDQDVVFKNFAAMFDLNPPSLVETVDVLTRETFRRPTQVIVANVGMGVSATVCGRGVFRCFSSLTSVRVTPFVLSFLLHSVTAACIALSLAFSLSRSHRETRRRRRSSIWMGKSF